MVSHNAMRDLDPGSRVVPEPLESRYREGAVSLRGGFGLAADPAFGGVAGLFAEELGAAAGVSGAGAAGMPRPTIALVRDEALGAELGGEGYALDIDSDGARARASGGAGAFYATRTILQLLDAEGRLPFGTLRDRPRFGWRGMMLDAARHFIPLADVKRLVDLLALYKLNLLHLHLTDDQGWRMEIESHPRLVSVGSRRAGTVVGRPGPGPARLDEIPVEGFYSKAELRELVAYAAARSVSILPEIDMPGHARAAIAAYPELGPGGPVEVSGVWGVEPIVLNASEGTLGFFREVLDEVAEVFPGPFIHFGGDEVPETQWRDSLEEARRMDERGLAGPRDLHGWFAGQMASHIASLGRRAAGWDEVHEAGVDASAVIMCWRGEGRAVAAARAGRDVVMAPTSHTYFDYRESLGRREPLSIGGYIPLRRILAWEPVPRALRGCPEAARILGGQAQLWTEYAKDGEQVEYLAFPRALALAEALWSAPGRRSARAFRRKLPRQLGLLAAKGAVFRFPSRARRLGLVAFEGKTTARLELPEAARDARGFQLLAWREGGASFGIEGARLLDQRDGTLAASSRKGRAGGFAQGNVHTLYPPAGAVGEARALEIDLRAEGGRARCGLYLRTI